MVICVLIIVIFKPHRCSVYTALTISVHRTLTAYGSASLCLLFTHVISLNLDCCIKLCIWFIYSSLKIALQSNNGFADSIASHASSLLSASTMWKLLSPIHIYFILSSLGLVDGVLRYRLVIHKHSCFCLVVLGYA